MVLENIKIAGSMPAEPGWFGVIPSSPYREMS